MPAPYDSLIWWTRNLKLSVYISFLFSYRVYTCSVFSCWRCKLWVKLKQGFGEWTLLRSGMILTINLICDVGGVSCLININSFHQCWLFLVYFEAGSIQFPCGHATFFISCVYSQHHKHKWGSHAVFWSRSNVCGLKVCRCKGDISRLPSHYQQWPLCERS